MPLSGRNGAGKSTLLNCPPSGQSWIPNTGIGHVRRAVVLGRKPYEIKPDGDFRAVFQDAERCFPGDLQVWQRKTLP